jgi:hypothetical protein
VNAVNAVNDMQARARRGSHRPASRGAPLVPIRGRSSVKPTAASVSGEHVAVSSSSLTIRTQPFAANERWGRRGTRPARDSRSHSAPPPRVVPSRRIMQRKADPVLRETCGQKRRRLTPGGTGELPGEASPAAARPGGGRAARFPELPGRWPRHASHQAKRAAYGLRHAALVTRTTPPQRPWRGGVVLDGNPAPREAETAHHLHRQPIRLTDTQGAAFLSWLNARKTSADTPSHGSKMRWS